MERDDDGALVEHLDVGLWDVAGHELIGGGLAAVAAVDDALGLPPVLAVRPLHDLQHVALDESQVGRLHRLEVVQRHRQLQRLRLAAGHRAVVQQASERVRSSVKQKKKGVNEPKNTEKERWCRRNQPTNEGGGGRKEAIKKRRTNKTNERKRDGVGSSTPKAQVDADELVVGDEVTNENARHSAA